MKLTLVALTAALGLASAKKAQKLKSGIPRSSIKAGSTVGQKVLSKARRLEQDENEEIDYTWVAGMSLKFQGCYNTQQWNEEANDEEDLRITTQRLVRFR